MQHLYKIDSELFNYNPSDIKYKGYVKKLIGFINLHSTGKVKSVPIMYRTFAEIVSPYADELKNLQNVGKAREMRKIVTAYLEQ
jgi:hypothetical protein